MLIRRSWGSGRQKGKRMGFPKNNCLEKYIVNLVFLKDYEGVYCYKTDEEGNTIGQAYLHSSLKRLIIVNDSEYTIYNWDSPDINMQNEHKHYICVFLDELANRPLLLKGKPYDQKLAETYWQLYNPQQAVPYKFKKRIEEIIKMIH